MEPVTVIILTYRCYVQEEYQPLAFGQRSAMLYLALIAARLTGRNVSGTDFCFFFFRQGRGIGGSVVNRKRRRGEVVERIEICTVSRNDSTVRVYWKWKKTPQTCFPVSSFLDMHP